MVAPCAGAAAFIAAEELAKGGLVGKTQLVRDMRDSVLMKQEHGFCLSKQSIGNTGKSTLPCGETYTFGYIFGRETELVGIELQFVLLAVATIYEVHEAIGNLFFARSRHGYVRLNGIDDAIDESLDDVLQHLIVGDEMIGGVVHAKIGSATVDKGDDGKWEADHTLRMAKGAAVEDNHLVVEMQCSHSAEQFCTRYGKSLDRRHKQ